MGNLDRQDAGGRGGDTDQYVGAKSGRSRPPFSFESDQSAKQRGEEEPRCNDGKGEECRMGDFLYECAHRYEAYLNSGKDFSESLVAPGSTIFFPLVRICS